MYGPEAHSLSRKKYTYDLGKKVGLDSEREMQLSSLTIKIRKSVQGMGKILAVTSDLQVENSVSESRHYLYFNPAINAGRRIRYNS